MKIDNNLIKLVGIAGVFAIMIMVVTFMAFGMGNSKDFVSVSEMLTGIGLQIFNVSAGKDKESEGEGAESE